MRELTDAELELISGGLNAHSVSSNEDIVVTGSPYPPPYYPPPYYPPPPGYYPPTYPPPSGGGGGGGGGDTELPPIQASDENGNSVTIEPTVNPTTKTADLDVILANSVGSFTTHFDLADFDLQTFKLTINDGPSSYSTTFNVDSNAVTGTYGLDFGGGATGSFSFTTNGSSYSIGLTFNASL